MLGIGKFQMENQEFLEFLQAKDRLASIAQRDCSAIASYRYMLFVNQTISLVPGEWREILLKLPENLQERE